MRRVPGMLWLWALLFSSCSDTIISMVKTAPFNPEWQFTQAGKNNWLPAAVPGVVHTDLYKNNLVEDPFFNDNEMKLEWIADTDWQYRARFHISDSLLKYKSVDFIFKGIDTYATVYINDSVLLHSDNMFREWRSNGKRLLKSGMNEMKVVLYSPVKRGNEERAKLPYPLPMSNDAGAVKVSSFVRKAPYHFGWDWSPRMVTSGIWLPVYISAHDDVYFKSVHYKTIEIADTCAWLNANVTLYSGYDLPNAVVTVRDGFRQFRLKKGTSTVPVRFKIDNPKLWWPNGFGSQPLYEITTKLYINGYLTDTITDRTGIRTIELFRDEDEWGTGFYFRVNGLPVFMKGANYVPQSNFLPEVTDSSYKRLIADVKSVGMNMLRVWGGGAYERDIFYDLCDEHGILVWQDFMFACSMYPGDSAFIANVGEEVRYQVSRLGNHPSIALWCGNNEISVAWENWGWQKDFAYSPADSAEIFGNYRLLFDEAIPRWLEEVDGTRPYLPSSPESNWGKRENFTKGNMHYWGVWHGEEDIDSFHVNVPRFMTEYGMQSYPSFKSLSSQTSDTRITLGSGFLSGRQKSYKGNRLLIDYIKNRYGSTGNVEDLCYLSQLNQADALQVAIESHKKEARYCMGTLYWQLNDVWDGASWSTIEHNGTWKAAHYRLRRLYARNILIAETQNDTTVIYLQSDNTEGAEGKLKVEALDFKGRSLGTYWSEAATGYLVATRVFTMPVRELLRGNDRGSFFLKISLQEGDTSLAETTHYFEKPAGQKLPDPEIKKEIRPVAGGVSVTLFSHSLTRGVMLWYPTAQGHFSDNYFDLLPGVEKEVFFNGDPKGEELQLNWYRKE